MQFHAMFLLALHAVKICIYLRCYNAKYWWYLRLMRLRTLVTLSAKPPVKCFSTTFSQLCFMAKLSEQNPSFDISTAMLFDSGCSQHTFFDENLFSELRNYGPGEIVPTITGIGDTILQPTGVGTVTVSCNVNDAPQALTLRNVLFCPSLKANLISCSQLLSHDEVLITLMPHGCEVLLNQRPVAQARHQFGLFILNTWEDRALAFQSYTAHGGSNDDGSAFPAYGTTNSALEQLWHRRMGHLGIQNLRKLQHMSTGLDLSHLKQKDCVCEACLKGRMHDIAHRNALADGARPYEVIYSDVAGPIKTLAYDGSRYFVTFMDASTKESEVYSIKYKSEVPACFRRYKALKERPQEGIQIRRFHSDGGEYLGYDFQLAHAEDGITFSYSVPYSQQQNGAAERLNRTLEEKAESELEACQLSKKYWPLALKHANYVRNRSPVAGGTTPFTSVKGYSPELDYMRPFGCLVWYRQGSQAKLRTFYDSHAAPGTFVGFESPHIIRILSQTDRILRAAAVHFQEYRTIKDANRPNLLKHPEIDDSDIPFYTETTSKTDVPQS